MTALLPAQIALWAVAGVGVAFSALAIGRAAIAPAADATLAARARGALRAIAQAAFAFALFGSFAVLALLLLSGALIAAEAPKVVYLFTAALGGFVLWRGIEHSSGGMEGCTRFWIISWGVYGLSWSAASLLLLPDVADARWSLAAIVRPLVVAAPLAAFVHLASRSSRKLAQSLGALAIFAAIAALVFFPVETGFAARLLPRSDWLRFPLVGAVSLAAVAALPQLVRLIQAIRPGATNRNRRAWKGTGRTLGLAAVLGALLGILWAVTRSIQDLT